MFGALNIRAQQSAIDSLERAHRSRPNDPAILYDLGTAYKSAGKYAGATTAYEEAVRLRPDNPSARSTPIFPYLDIGRNEKALAMVRKGAAMMGEDGLAGFGIGITFDIHADHLLPALQPHGITGPSSRE
jgi:Flp pilus assembly protein TadD